MIEEEGQIESDLEEDQELEKRGFVTENMIGQFYKKKQRKSQKSEEYFQSLIEKKFSNKKKEKTGGKTNK